ncbi:hypothetical protein SDJN02_05583, partial [Cucurbita argyrosperma subsp. argyrosperma]
MSEFGNRRCQIEVIHLAIVNETEFTSGRDRMEGRNLEKNHEENEESDGNSAGAKNGGLLSFEGPQYQQWLQPIAEVIIIMQAISTRSSSFYARE